MIKVKLDQADDLGVRRVKIKLNYNDKNIVGPTRTINSTDLGYLGNLSSGGIHEDYGNCDLYECRKTFGLLELALFSKGSTDKVNESFITKLKQTKAEMPPESKLSFFRPHIEIDSTTSLPFKVSEKADYILQEFPIHAGFDLVPIQDPGVTEPIEIYDKRMERGTERILKATTKSKKWFIPLPTLDCRTVDKATTKERCKVLQDRGHQIIQVVAGNLAHLPSLQVVSDYFSDKDVAIIGSQIPKYIFGASGKPSISGIHHFQIYGFTTLSTILPRSFSPTWGKNVHNVKKPKRFDSSTGFFFSRGEHSFKYGEDLKCTCPLCVRARTLTGFFENHKNMHGITALKAKAHEVFASIEEFKKSNELIGEMKEYFKQREGLYGLVKNRILQKGLSAFA